MLVVLSLLGSHCEQVETGITLFRAHFVNREGGDHPHSLGSRCEPEVRSPVLGSLREPKLWEPLTLGSRCEPKSGISSLGSRCEPTRSGYRLIAARLCRSALVRGRDRPLPLPDTSLPAQLVGSPPASLLLLGVDAAPPPLTTAPCFERFVGVTCALARNSLSPRSSPRTSNAAAVNVDALINAAPLPRACCHSSAICAAWLCCAALVRRRDCPLCHRHRPRKAPPISCLRFCGPPSTLLSIVALLLCVEEIVCHRHRLLDRRRGWSVCRRRCHLSWA